MAYQMQTERYRELARESGHEMLLRCVSSFETKYIAEAAEDVVTFENYADQMDKLAHSLPMDKSSEVLVSSGWESVKF
jgi:hypothetical protein